MWQVETEEYAWDKAVAVEPDGVRAVLLIVTELYRDKGIELDTLQVLCVLCGVIELVAQAHGLSLEDVVSSIAKLPPVSEAPQTL